MAKPNITIDMASLAFPGDFNVRKKAPLDAREQVEKYEDLFNKLTWESDTTGNTYLWKGMQTYVQETGEWYELVAEPTNENIVKTTSWKKVKSSVIDDTKDSICIVPAFMFDKSGYRLGYGKGYYDRYLSKYKGSTIGICYSQNIKDELFHGKFDRTVDMIVTEKQIITIKE